MQTAQFIEALQSDLRELAQLGGEELVQAAHRLEGAVKQSATLRLIDALTQVALEVSSQLPNGHLDVRLCRAGPGARLRRGGGRGAAGAKPPRTASPPGSPFVCPSRSRSRSRRPRSAEGVSVNTWLVRALERSVSSGGGRAVKSGKRITGYAQS